jgi:hypothetical protein
LKPVEQRKTNKGLDGQDCTLKNPSARHNSS